MKRPSAAEFDAAIERIWPNPEHARVCRDLLVRQPELAARIFLEALEIVTAEGYPSDEIADAFGIMCAELGIELRKGMQA